MGEVQYGAARSFVYAAGFHTDVPVLDHIDTPNAVFTAEFRYPVTNTYGSATSKQPGWTTFSMSYADNGAGGSVTADVMEVDSCSTTERSLCSLTSADGNGATACDTCTLSSALDFSNHSYYVHVTITKTDLPADPKLYELALY